MNSRRLRRAVGILSITLAAACSGHDSDFIPYAVKGLDVWVYDDASGKEFYGGRIKASYFSRKAAVDQCGAAAYAVAAQYHLRDWSYICCTVTPSSDCATKVR